MQLCYRVHKIPSLVYIVSHMEPVHILMSYLFNTHFNIIIPSTTKSYNWCLVLNFLDYNSVEAYAFLISLSCVLLAIRIASSLIFYKTCALWSSSLCKFIQPHLRSSLYPAINTTNLSTFLPCVRHQVSHPYKTKHKVIYILIVTF
jgi:hypothetical protein